MAPCRLPRWLPHRRLVSTQSPPTPACVRRLPPFYDPRQSQQKTASEAVNNLLYDTPLISLAESRRHILSCLVANSPGVLSRVAGVLAGRGFNIDSLVVSQTDVADLSRMTIALCGSSSQRGMMAVEQARRQLEDLIEVWAVLDYTDTLIIEREVCLVKMSLLPEDRPTSPASPASPESASSRPAGPTSTPNHPVSPIGFCHYVPPKRHLFGPDFQRQALVELARLFQGRVLDVTVDSLTVEVCAKPRRIDAFLALCRPYGILEVVRSGMMAIPRSPVDPSQIQAFTADSAQLEDDDGSVDATQLPPG